MYLNWQGLQKHSHPVGTKRAISQNTNQHCLRDRIAQTVKSQDTKGFSSFSCSLWFTSCLPTITFQFQEPLFYFLATSTQILMLRCFAHIPKSSGWLRWRHRCPEGVGTWVLYIDFQINEIIVPIPISQSQKSHRLYVEAIYPEAQSINL